MYLIKRICFQGKVLKAQEGLVLKGEIQTAYSGGV